MYWTVRALIRVRGREMRVRWWLVAAGTAVSV